MLRRPRAAAVTRCGLQTYSILHDHAGSAIHANTPENPLLMSSPLVTSALHRRQMRRSLYALYRCILPVQRTPHGNESNSVWFTASLRLGPLNLRVYASLSTSGPVVLIDRLPHSAQESSAVNPPQTCLWRRPKAQNGRSRLPARKGLHQRTLHGTSYHALRDPEARPNGIVGLKRKTQPSE